MIVLDTNVLSEVLRPRPEPRVVAWLEGLDGDVAITAVTLAELLAGLRRLPDGRRKAELSAAVTAALEPYRDGRAILPFDEACADAYVQVLLARERIGLPISTADAQIAAICWTRGATCATRNTADFAGTGIELIDPWSAPAGEA